MNRQGFSLLLAEVRSGFDRLRRDVVYACSPIDVARAQVALEALEMTAKTPAERQAERKARELAAGCAQWTCWVHPDDVPALAECADKLARKRARAEQTRRTSAKCT